jgi:hypothetical protein
VNAFGKFDPVGESSDRCSHAEKIDVSRGFEFVRAFVLAEIELQLIENRSQHLSHARNPIADLIKERLRFGVGEENLPPSFGDRGPPLVRRSRSEGDLAPRRPSQASW